MLKLLVILLLSVSSLTQTTGPQILQISSSPNSISRPVYSSLRGGALIYIKAIGHNPMASNNLIYVGNFPCIIPSDGVTDTFITCQTTDSGSKTNINNLQITLVAYGMSFTTSWPNVVIYTQSYTSYLSYVFPSAGFANRTVNLHGLHKISNLGDGRDMGDVVAIKLGTDICSRFDVVQAANNPYILQMITCIQSSSQEAGKYNVSELVTPGFAENNQMMRRSSLIKGQYFQFTVLPTVTSVSPSSGNIGGQKITIQGTGFSVNPANVSVTVDNNICQVTDSSATQISCTLGARNASLSSKMVTNSTNQTNPYFSGVGLNYARYQKPSYMSMNQFVTAVRSNNTASLGAILQIGIRTQIREPDIHGPVYGQVWKGYFTAPVTGSYNFRGQADDQFAVYISSNYGSTDPASSPLIYSNTYQFFNDFYYGYRPTAQGTIVLQGGKSYYIEAYHINIAGAGFFILSIDVPNLDTTLPFQSYEVRTITTNTTIQPEVVIYSMVGGSSGYINLRAYRVNASNGAVLYDVNQNVTYGCTASAFQSALNSFDAFSGYQISVQRNIYNSSNQTTTNISSAARIDYIVSIYLLRSAADQAQTFITTYRNYTGLLVVTPTTQHSPLINGTWTLTVGGVTIDPYLNNYLLPYNADSSYIQTGLRTIVGFEQVQVAAYFPNANGFGYGCTWLIKFIGYNAAVPNIIANGAGLTGGTTSPSITIALLHPYSSAITFEADYRFLNTYSSLPNVIVKVNGVPSVCLTNCGYTFSNDSQVRSLTLNSSTLQLSLNGSALVNVTASDVSITVNGLACTVNSTAPLSSLTCTLSTNNGSSPVLVAGNLIPVIFAKLIGFIQLGSGVSPIQIPLFATSLSKTSGGNNGGYLVTLKGSGFPFQLNQASISICSNLATIESITNTQIIFYMPPCSSIGNQTVSLTVGSLTNTNLTFAYTDSSLSASTPTITSLSPTSSNPALKGIITITGNNFGSNISLVNVFLSNSSGKVYKLSILSFNNTIITAGISGGLPGNFVLQVGLPSTVGDSISSTSGSNLFSYSVRITSISPQIGSYSGGTLITITGQNFSPATSDTLVFIGDTLNWFCTIQNITTTQIQCRTPSIGVYSPGVGQKVVISTKLIVLNTCSGNCNFTYLNAGSSPNLTSLSVNTTNAQNVTLTGTNFTNGGTLSICKVSLTNTDNNAVTILSTLACSDTSAVFAVLNTVMAGNYKVQLLNDIGQSNFRPLVVNWVPGTPSYNSGGSVVGSLVTFTGGSGYPSSIANPFYIFITSTTATYSTKILSCCAGNNLTMLMPAAPNVTTMTITFKSPANPSSPPTKLYTTYLSKTPIISIISAKMISVGSNTIQVNRTSSANSAVTGISLVSTTNALIVTTISNWITNGTLTTFNATLAAGPYQILVNSADGYYQCTDILNVKMLSAISGSSQVASFAGGIYTINGNLSPASYIIVNNLKGKIVNYTSNVVTYQIPPLVTLNSNTAFGLSAVSLINMGQLTYFSDQNASLSNVSAVFDGKISTMYGSPNVQCWIGMDIGYGLYASIARISFFPYLRWSNTANYILYATFQGSNDQSTWTTLGAIDQTVHSGYNTIMSLSSNPFRYIRFRHNSTSQCNIAEIKLYGTIFSNMNISLTSQMSDVIYQDGYNNYTITGGIEYRSDRTPIVQTVTPRYGTILGGYNITINGSNLGFGAPNVLIDGIQCVTVDYGSTFIKCTVGGRPNLPTSNTFNVSIGSNIAIINNGFLYVLRWSDSYTWGVDLPPVDGDLVYVPQGMTLLIDKNTPVLAGIAVQNGTIIFSDDADLVVQAGFITVVGGRFLAGTENNPYIHKLTFVLYGNYYGTQQPMFGNKGIGCLECQFSMYGIPRQPTWTTIAATISPGDTIFTVSQNVDWQVGEQIVIASTSFLHYQAEKMKITAINNHTITVNTPFLYKHVSIIQNYGASDKLVMQAEVGLLTRNIKVMGDSTSAVGKYGAHLMMAGSAANGFEGHVAYTQFYHCGQPQILGRYCIHFHMNGEIPTSYARGNAVHESFARVVTIHAVYFLTVELNVGYRVHGHNFFVEDGIQTKNVIRYNLAISSLTVTNMLQTDISVASFWVTNPSNDFYGNRAAGGDFYGVWYEIKSNPDGPSATNDVCPIGNPLGKVQNNTAHSNIRFGLRIFKLYSRQYPCQPIRNDSNANGNPWSYNPSITSKFTNFTVYKNMQDGILAEQAGDVVFDQFVIAESYHAGVEFYMGNFTQKNVMVTNSVIIGKSMTNAASDPTNYTLGMAGVITPRTGASNFSNIRFYNFPSGSIAFITCSMCDDSLQFTNTGTQVFVQKLTFNQVNGSYLEMLGLNRDIIYDADASMAPVFDGITRTSATIVSNFPHIAAFEQNICLSASQPEKWENAVMCDQSATIRKIMFTNLNLPNNFNKQAMKATVLNTFNETVRPNISSSLYTSIVSFYLLSEPMVQLKQTWSLPYLTGRIYNIWWGSGIDFTNLSISSTRIFSASDDGVIFKFNYTTNRELYSVGPIVGRVPFTTLNQIAQSSGYLYPSNCSNGDYYHNNDNSALRMFTICQSGKNKSLTEYTQVNAIYCKFVCPAAAGSFVKQSFVRRWSNATQWPNGTVPRAGENVTVNGNWTVLMDVNPAPAAYMIIDGDLVFDDSRDVNITAQSIFIRAGNVTVGSPNSPFQHFLTIQVNGLKLDAGYVIDPIVAGNKFLVVTGSLNLYGITPRTVTTYLTQIALKGSSTIYVAASLDWQVGDTIALAPSFSNALQYETVTIQSINSNGSVTVTPVLNYTHYGDSSITISNSYGQLDTRAQVGHINRNIKIVSGPDVAWGFNMIVYGFMDGTTRRVGSVNLMGVQFLNGGQYDTLNSALVFLNTANGNYTSSVVGTSFVNCKAYCVNINNAHNLTMTNNVFYNAWVIGVFAQNMLSFAFTYNVFIGVVDRPNIIMNKQLVACFATFNYINPITDQVFIQNNICQGSVGHGFAFPHIKCTEINTHTMGNNTAGSCLIGFIFTKIAGDCQAASWIKAYACKIGQIVNPPSTLAMIFSNFIMADNQRALSLKFGNEEGKTNHTAYLYNSYITALSRPSCTVCYGSSATVCSGVIGARMFTASNNGQTLPHKFGDNFDVICKQEVFDCKIYISNVIFDSYRQAYPGALSSVCSGNFVFRTHHDSMDYVGGHNLFNSTCTNCDTNSYVICDPNLASQLGWFGGCGDILCTGKQNYLIHDFSGTFLPFKGVIIPNNPTIGDNEVNCTRSTIMNGHLCQRQDFATLEYQSIAPDFNTRIMWPVNLTYDGSNYTTMTNAFREWHWIGIQPGNTRIGRFYSIVKLQSVYNMTFTSQPPSDMQFQIQKRTPLGNNANFVVVKMKFALPNTIRSRVNGVTMPSILITDDGLSRPLNTSLCGDNIYFFKNYTIHFVVTEDLNCLVRITVTQSIQLTTRFQMNPADFYKDTVMSSFISNLCAILQITDTSRVKIVGVTKGSTIVTSVISPPQSNSTNSSASDSSSLSAISTTITSLIKDGSLYSNLSGAVNATVGQIQFVHSLPQTSSNNSTNPSIITNNSSNLKIGVIIGVIVAVISIGMILTIFCCIRKRRKISEYVRTSEGVYQEEEFQIERSQNISKLKSDNKRGSQNSNQINKHSVENLNIVHAEGIRLDM